jgi:predicted acyl esterase
MPSLPQIAGRPINPPKVGVNNYQGFQPNKTEILPKGWNGYNSRPLPCDILVEHDVGIKVRDGCTLYCDIYRPNPATSGPEHQKVPALICWSPFGKKLNGLTFLPMMTPYNIGVPDGRLSGLEKFEAPDPAEFVPRGYAVINADSRGVGDSDGMAVIMGTQEGEDGYDVIEAIAKMDWCTGNVGLAGNSHLAICQWFIAQQQPPSLKAIAPWEGCGDLFREQFVRGGIYAGKFFRLISDKMVQGYHGLEDFDEMHRRSPLSNAHWEDKRPDMTKIKVPAYITGTYSNPLHAMGAIRSWLEIDNPNKWLRFTGIQEWHEIWADQPSLDELALFFDRFLKDKHDNGWDQTPRVRMTTLQFGEQDPLMNIVVDDFPLPQTEYKQLYLTSDQSLQTSPSSSEFTSYDSRGNTPAVFSFVFKEKTRLMGIPKAVMYMSCNDLDDMDVYVLIRKLDKDGKPMLSLNIPWHSVPFDKIADIPRDKLSDLLLYQGPTGILRASHREIDPKRSINPNYPFHPHTREQKIPPGTITKLEIGMWPMGIDYEAGQGLQVQVWGHNPQMHPHKGLEGSAPNELNRGFHHIHTGLEHPSHIVLPFVPL